MAKMDSISVLREGDDLAILEGLGRAEAIVTPRLGSRFRSLHRIDLLAGSATIAMAHPGEAVYAVVAGKAYVEAAGQRTPLKELSMVFVPAGCEYRFVASGSMTIIGGPCPPDDALYDEPTAVLADRHLEPEGSLIVLDAERDGQPIPMISRQARIVVWPQMGARIASMNYVVLEPGEENVPHVHASSEDTIAILEGRGSIDDLSEGTRFEFGAGDVVHVRAGVEHKVNANRGERIRSVGGPCPPDFDMLRSCGLID